MPLVRRGANFASLRSKADGSRRFTFGKLSAVTIVSSDVRDALRQLIDVTGASKALAHAQFPLLEAHQRKGGVRQRGFYGDSGNRSAARLRNRIYCVVGFGKGHMKHCHVGVTLTSPARGDGDYPAADAARYFIAHKSNSPRVPPTVEISHYHTER
jgi:hypothetical protein